MPAPGAEFEAESAAHFIAERRAAGLGAPADEDDLPAVARSSAEVNGRAGSATTPSSATKVQDWLAVAENVGAGTR